MSSCSRRIVKSQPAQRCSLTCPRHVQRRWQSSAPHTHRIAVLGGGVTGLTTAYLLSKALPRAHITLYEASDRVGGWLSAKRVPVKDGTVLFESGPRTLRSSPEASLALSLLKELDLDKEGIYAHRTSPAARNRYIYYPDHLVCLPHPSFGLANNIWTCLTEPVLKGVLTQAATEIFKAHRDPDIRDESVGQFFSRRMSKGFVDRLFSALMHGIYAGDVWQLSARSLFKTLWRAELASGSVVANFVENRKNPVIFKTDLDFAKESIKMNAAMDPLLAATAGQSAVFTFKDGLGSLSEKLARKCLEVENIEFRFSSPVEKLSMTEGDTESISILAKDSKQAQEYSHVISALSPKHLNQILASPNSSPLIPDVPASTVMTVNLYYRSPNLVPEGFGYLIPQATSFEQNPERALGVIFDNAYSPSRADTDMKNWNVSSMDDIEKLRASGNLVQINGFSYYNIPDQPNFQDDVPDRGTKLTVMLGGHYWNDWPSHPDREQGLALAKSLLRRHLNITEEPEAWHATLQQDCIPQYTVGHTQRLKLAHNNLWMRYRGRVRVAGNWMWGVGVNDAMRSAWEVVEALRQGRDGTGLEHIGNDEVVAYGPKSE